MYHLNEVIMNKFLFFIILFSLLGGCALTPEKVCINPDVRVIESEAGKGKTVALTVTDARADKVLGYRTTRLDKDSIILTDSDLAKVVQQRAFEGLKKYGFNVDVLSEGAPRSLRVEV